MPESPPGPSRRTPVFCTTRWTLVSRARGESPEARAALGDLCEAYWSPVHRFLMRDGKGEDESRELTQEFISQLLTTNAIEMADPRKGRFRSYLLGALKHFLSNGRRAANAQKRGGDAVIQSIESGGTETSPGLQVPDREATPADAWFDRHWALAVMERGMTQVEKSFEEAGKQTHFEILKPWLIGDNTELNQSEAAERLGMSGGAVKVAIHRLRHKFGEAIRAEIAETVDSEEEIRDELRYLIEALQAS